MATSLAAQLAQVAANSKSTLNVKAQKAAHSKSLIWEPRVAATQSYQSLYATCVKGFEELCQLDARFVPFQSTLFAEESQNQDRMQLTQEEVDQLDKHIEAFLHLVAARLRLMPAIKSLEWLIRRFRIHEENTRPLLLSFLPFHSIPAFTTLLSILPAKIPQEFRFLDPYIRSLTNPPRSVFVRHAIQQPSFLVLVSDYTLDSCHRRYQYPALIAFWGGMITEAVSGILDRTKSGRAAVQAENDQALLQRIGPIFADGLVVKKAPSMQIATYMAIAVFVSKASLEDVALTAFMEQTVHGWTSETVKPGLICLSILAQFRSAKQMSSKVTKALMKVNNIGTLLVEIGHERRVDKLANGLCLALIERISKKGDARGLAPVISILSSQILQERQVAVMFKSLLLTALKLDESSDEYTSLKRELGSALIGLSQLTGRSGEVIQSAIQEVDFDLEELEMKLDLSFRTQKALPESTSDSIDVSNGAKETPARDIAADVERLSTQTESLPNCLSGTGADIFDDFSRVFFSIVLDQSRKPQMLEAFDQVPQLKQDVAFRDGTYFAFFTRIWCGPFPAMARAAALDATRRRIGRETKGRPDMQALVPYVLAALGDPSKRVRRAASELATALGNSYKLSSNTKMSAWAASCLYGGSKPTCPTLSTDVAAKFLLLQVIPVLEECVLDQDHIFSAVTSSIRDGKYAVTPDPALDKKDHLSQNSRLALFAFLAAHTIATPILTVKGRLLRSLTDIRSVSSTSRTDLLLPALKWWAGLTEAEAVKLAEDEQLDKDNLDGYFVDIVLPGDDDGLGFFFAFLRDSAHRDRVSLIRAIFNRLRKGWTSMKSDIKFKVAEQLLSLVQDVDSAEASDLVQGEAAEMLRAVPLTTDILSFFLESVHTGTKSITEPPPNKRRRTSSSEANRGNVVQVSPQLGQALQKVTFVLQLVDNSDPVSHPELLDALFTMLSELQHYRTVVGSELGYLQNLILRSLLAMMPAYKSNGNLKIDSSGGYGDLLVNCIQRSSSGAVQSSALLLIAELVTTAPNLVLHSVMPVFTFMGTSVLRQSDDYSAHVVSQTIKQVVPPLIASLRKGSKNPVTGASDLLISFVTAYEHVPAHRRLGLFVALVETLGPRDFMFALISMLVDRYGASDALLRFTVELLNSFSAEIQLSTLTKLLDLIADLFRPKPGMSFALLGGEEDADGKDVDELALRQLQAYPSFLSSKRLMSKVSKMTEEDDMEASEIRRSFVALLQGILTLADTVKSKKVLHSRCGAVLSNLLNLLSISEFIRAVESLLDRPDMGLRQKVLRALEVRVDSESRGSAESRAVLLAFLPQLTAAIRDSSDMRYKHTAITCVDKIAEKYGKKDLEAVAAAAMTIAGEHCLGDEDQRLQVMALLCLTSLVDVLQEATVPVLPIALPQCLKYLETSLQGEEVDAELHAACYGLITALAEHLPYMLTSQFGKILAISNKSAEAELDDETKSSRTAALQFLVKQLDAKEVFLALDRNWESARSAGLEAVSEYMSVLGLAIDKHSKSVISKNSACLSSILLKAFDLRRHVVGATGTEASQDVVQKLAEIEVIVNDTALKMIYKLNDASFRPIFTQLVEFATSGLDKKDVTGRQFRQYSVFGFLQTFFGSLKSIVTNYATFIVDDAVGLLRSLDVKDLGQRRLWSRVLATLAQCFEHDQDDFWQAPAHFEAVATTLMAQLLQAADVDAEEDVIPALVELAAAADSQAHQKTLNTGLLQHLKSGTAAVRLAGVKCEQAMTDRLGEDWLSMLPEMRWIVKIEDVLGESLDAMLI